MSRALRWGVVPVAMAATLVLSMLVFGLPLGDSLMHLWQGAAGDKFGLARSLVRSTPLILCGLGIVVAWRSKMYNIGGEGQYVVGGLVAAWGAQLLGGLMPAWIPAILFSVAGGMAWAGVAAWLHAKRGVQVVISTILLNFLALQLLEFLIQGPLQEGSHRLPQTERLARGQMLAGFDPQTDLHAGVLIAVLASVMVWALLFYTWPGFRLRLVGANARAAHVARVPVVRTQVLALMFSGALCGLAGGVDYAGLIGQVGPGFSQNWGFLAIPVALLGALNPLGVLASGVFFGALFAGSENIARYNTVGGTVVYILQAAAMLAYVAVKTRIEHATVREGDG